MNNNFSLNTYEGIYIVNCEYNIIKNNTIDVTGMSISGGAKKYWNSHVIDTNNTVNGKPIYYLKNLINENFSLIASQIIIANCSNVIVRNQIFDSVVYGIKIGFSDNITIQNNSFRFCKRDGIYLYSSKSNVIELNYFSLNYGHGLNLYLSDLNIVNFNNFGENNINGIYLKDAHDNKITNNSIGRSNENGILLEYSDINYIINNSCYSNSYDGLIISRSNGNNVKDNYCYSNGWSGIVDVDSLNTIITNNICKFNQYSGIGISRTSSCSIKNNSCNSNDIDGINIYNCGDFNNPFEVTIINNTCEDNENAGVYIEDSNSLKLIKNTCNNNLKNGFELSHTSDINISNNTAQNNQGSGIWTEWLWSSRITNNNISNNVYGIYLTKSQENKVFNNTCLSNNYIGLLLDECHKNHIYSNNYSFNNDGIYLYYSSGNILEKNKCGSNGFGIQIIEDSDGNNIENNCIFNNSNTGINIDSSVDNQITKNELILNIGTGLKIESAKNTLIKDNNCRDNKFGISCTNSDLLDIDNNTVSFNNDDGISLLDCFNCEIHNNNITNNNYGLLILESRLPNVENNLFSNNTKGIFLRKSISGVFTENDFLYDEVGLHIYHENRENLIYHNNFYYPDTNILGFAQDNFENEIYFNNFIGCEATDSGENIWNNDRCEGNYWSLYDGSDNGANNRIGGDGVGDTNLPMSGVDFFPLMEPDIWNKMAPPKMLKPDEVDLDGDYKIQWTYRGWLGGFILEEDDNSIFNSPAEILNSYINPEITFINDRYDINIEATKAAVYNISITGRADGTYYYRIRAHKYEEISDWSNIINTTVITIPDLPTNISVSVWPYGNALNLTWEPGVKSKLIRNYELYAKSDGPWVLLANLTQDVFSYDHVGLIDGVEYSYTMRVWDTINRSSDFSDPVKGTPIDTIAPDTPKYLVYSNKTFNTITLTWENSTAADVLGYNLYRSNQSNEIIWNQPINGEKFIKNNYYIDLDLLENTTFLYVVTAVDEVPNESGFSNVLEVRTYLSKEYPQPPKVIESQPFIYLGEDTTDQTSINLLEWFDDPNDDVLTFECKDNNNINIQIDQNSGAVTIVPEQNWCGSETITFYANDGTFETSVKVKIIVTPVNDPPTKVKIKTPLDGSKIKTTEVVTFSGSCKDPDVIYGDILTYLWISDMDGVLGEGKVLTGIILSVGKHTISLKVSDQDNLTSQAQINITVKESFDDTGDDENRILDFASNMNIMLIILIILIVFILIFFIWHRRKTKGKVEIEVDYLPEEMEE
jgi:parallel beta-helix repeat protein